MTVRTALLTMWWAAIFFTVAYLLLGFFFIYKHLPIPEAVFATAGFHLAFAYLVNRHIPD